MLFTLNKKKILGLESRKCFQLRCFFPMSRSKEIVVLGSLKHQFIFKSVFGDTLTLEMLSEASRGQQTRRIGGD